ncbi:MAG: GDSL-type esterase/lipase family protein [Candidatus Sericytochromatia bacterium]|nr:GDSL-type esterase/lipase family protein [Candidatus Sericytochromatia bacterium]
MSLPGWVYVSLALNLVGLGSAAWLVRARGGWPWLRRRLARTPPDGASGAPLASPHWQTRTALYAGHPADLRHVVLLGDSLTEFGPWGELLPGHEVLNRGIAGDTVAGVAERLGPALAGPPRAIALLVGINDLLAGRPPEAVAEDLRELVTTIRAAAPGSRLLVQSLLPVRPEIVGAHHLPRIDRVNRALAPAARAAGASWLDLRPALAEPDSLSSDGLHLSAAGYRRWAAVLAAHL